MSFIQIVEVRTGNVDALREVELEWEKATEGRRTLRRSIFTTDRNDPTRHLVIAFFDSYEAAMENSNLPETTAFAEKFAAVVDVPPVFHDLDVVDDRS